MNSAHLKESELGRVGSETELFWMLSTTKFEAHCYSRFGNDIEPVGDGDGSTLRVTFEERESGSFLVGFDEERKKDLFSCHLINMLDRHWTTPVRCDWGEDYSPDAWTIIFQKRHQAEQFEKTLESVLTGSSNRRNERRAASERAEVLSVPELIVQPAVSHVVHRVQSLEDGLGADPSAKETSNCALRQREDSLERNVEEERKSRKTLMALPFDLVIKKDDEYAIFDFLNKNSDLITGERTKSYDFWDQVIRSLRPIGVSTSILYKYFHSKMLHTLKDSNLDIKLQFVLLKYYNFRLTPEDRREYLMRGWNVLVDSFGFILHWKFVEEEAIEEARFSERSFSPIGLRNRPPTTIRDQRIRLTCVDGPRSKNYLSPPAKVPRQPHVRFAYTTDDHIAQWKFVHTELMKVPWKKLKLSNSFWKNFRRYPHRKADTWRKHFEDIKSFLHEEPLPEKVMQDLYIKLNLQMTEGIKKKLEARFNALIELSAEGVVTKWEENTGQIQQVHESPHPRDVTLVANNAMMEDDDDEYSDKANPESPVFKKN